MSVLLQLPKIQAFDSNGDPLSGGKLHTYLPGTTTDKETFSDINLSTPRTNPVVLDSRGENVIYYSGKIKLVLKDANDAEIWTVDNVEGISQAQSVYYPNYNAADQGVTGDSDTIRFAVDTIGSDNATIVLQHNSGGATTTYTCSTNETIPANVNLIIENGALIADDASNATLTILGPVEAGRHKIFNWGAGSGTVDLAGEAAAGGKNLNPDVFAAWFVDLDDADHTADIQMAIDACDPGSAPNYGAFTSGQTLWFHPGTYEISDTINLKDSVKITGVEPGQPMFGEGNFQKTTVVFNSSISSGTADVFKFTFPDVADGQYATILLSNFSIIGSGNERDGIRVEGNGRNTNWLQACDIRNLMIEGVGNDGFHFNHYRTLAITIKGVRIWNPGNNGFTWQPTHADGGFQSAPVYESIWVNSPGNYGFYLNDMHRGYFLDCIVDGNNGTLNKGWYVTGNYNVFVDCDAETFSPSTGDALNMVDAENNTFINPKFVCDLEGGITFVNSPHNRFYGGQYGGNPANTTNFITFDAASYGNKFYGIRAGSLYDYDDFVDDNISAGSANLFMDTAILAPGTMVPATSPHSTWWTSEQVPDVLAFGNSAALSRGYTIFSDVQIMGRILPAASETAITSLTANTLDAEHLTVKTITLAGADDLDTISNGQPGQLLTLIFRNGNTTLKEGANLQLAGQVDFTPAQNDVVVFVAHTATQWFEVSRSENHA